MLNKDSKKLLNWIRKQGNPVTLSSMQEDSVPYFSDERFECLKENGYLTREFGHTTESGDLTAGYTVSDQGVSELEILHREQIRAMWSLICQLVTAIIAVAAFIKSFFF